MDSVITAAMVGGIFGGLIGVLGSSLLLIRFFSNRVQLLKDVEELKKQTEINRELTLFLICAFIKSDPNNLVKLIDEAVKRSGSNKEDSDEAIGEEDKI